MSVKTPEIAEKDTSERDLALQTIREGKRRKITIADVADIAVLCGSLCLTEAEAVTKLGFAPTQWEKYKTRHKGQGAFDHALTRVRAEKISSFMLAIDQAGKRDWRALSERLKFIAPDRFADKRGDQTPHQPAVQITVMLDAAKLAGYGGQPLVLSGAPKQLTDTQPVVVCDPPKTTT